MLCNKCNSEIDNNSKFCGYCGSPVGMPILNQPSEESNQISNLNNSSSVQSIENQQFNNINDVKVEQAVLDSKPITKLNNTNSTSNIQTQNSQSSNNNNSNKDILKILSLIFAIIGFGVAYFTGIVAIICFILGIIFGAIYKSKTKNKCFPLTLNIIGLILDIILIIVSFVLLNNAISDARNSLKESREEYENRIGEYEEQINNYNLNKNTRYEVGTWQCKDKEINTSEESENYIASIDLNENYTFKFIDLNDNSFATGDYNFGNLIKTENSGLTSIEYYSFVFFIDTMTKNNMLNSKYQFIKLSDKQFILINDNDNNDIYSCYKQ